MESSLCQDQGGGESPEHLKGKKLFFVSYLMNKTKGRLIFSSPCQGEKL